MEYFLNLRKTLPTLYEIQPLFYDERMVIEYLLAKEVFTERISCPRCRLSKLKLRANLKNYDCQNSSCRKK